MTPPPLQDWHPFPAGPPLRIEIHDAPGSERRVDTDEARIDRAWASIRAENPRAFNGPILAYESADPEQASVRVYRDEYKRLAVRPEIETGVTQLGVTGILEARDEAGVRHALLGLRSHATRVFGGMWEFGPSGGVDAPPIGQATMDSDDLWRVLINEIREEVGLPVDPDPSPPIGLLHDPEGQSVELIIRVPLRRPIEELIALIDAENGTSRWEYDAVRWVAFDDLVGFTEREPSIPTAASLAALLTAAG